MVTTQEMTEALIELFQLEDTGRGDLDAEAPHPHDQDRRGLERHDRPGVLVGCP